MNNRKQIDLNCDLGENFGHYQQYDDGLILPHITSANIACGFHAGDALTMQKSVQLAKQYAVALGAHPGYGDLVGFGRRNIALPAERIYAEVIYQIGALAGFARAQDYRLTHVKPHGAMYNMAATDDALAAAIAQAVYDYDKNLILVGLAGSALISAGRRIGLTVAQEAFADRRYLDDSRLVPRSQPNAVISDVALAVEQALMLALKSQVISVSGKPIDIVADTLCLHGDSAAARALVVAIKTALIENGVTLAPLTTVLGV